MDVWRLCVLRAIARWASVDARNGPGLRPGKGEELVRTRGKSDYIRMVL